MTEIPEHLLKRAQQAREKAEADAAPATPAAAASCRGESSEPASDPRIPAHLLERSRAAKAQTEGGRRRRIGRRRGRRARASRQRRRRGPERAAACPSGAGPGGHTQRLLTVVKSGSIQDVKASPVDKVHTWPHLLAAEFVAALACTAFTFFFSVWVNAPLLRAGQPQPDPEPFEGAVVLPRPAGTADDVPPDDRRRHPCPASV